MALNEQIRDRFPAEVVIEFYDDFQPNPTEIGDGIHLDQRGQDKRAWRPSPAARALVP